MPAYTCKKPEAVALVRVPQRVGQGGICVLAGVGQVVTKTRDGFDFESDTGEVASVEVWGTLEAALYCDCQRFVRCWHKQGGFCQHTRATAAMLAVHHDNLMV